jgi:hypothetical protein
MKSLVCPISPLRIDENAARVTGLTMAGLLGLYAATGAVVIPSAIALDYAIRAFTSRRSSPAGWFAFKVARLAGLPEVKIDKAPKVFAARVGFLFALTSALIWFVDPTASLVVALTLMGFALLESLLNVCVGCLVYTHVAFPAFQRRG